MPKMLARLTAIADRFAPCVQPTALLLTRLVFGQAFAVTGWGKLHHLDDVRAFFTELGIPLAAVQAPMVATFELVGGILLLLGFGTRYAALLLVSTMLVALVTAHPADFGPAVQFAKSFADVTPMPFVVGLLWLITHGAGSVSVDARLAKAKRAPA
jgi:putative oxidoreductase